MLFNNVSVVFFCPNANFAISILTTRCQQISQISQNLKLRDVPLLLAHPVLVAQLENSVCKHFYNISAAQSGST